MGGRCFEVERDRTVREGARNAEEEMVTPGRLELPTRSLGNCCSIHLSYGAIFRMNDLQNS